VIPPFFRWAGNRGAAPPQDGDFAFCLLVQVAFPPLSSLELKEKRYKASGGNPFPPGAARIAGSFPSALGVSIFFFEFFRVVLSCVSRGLPGFCVLVRLRPFCSSVVLSFILALSASLAFFDDSGP